MNIRIPVYQLTEMLHRILYVTYYIFNQKINSVVCCNLRQLQFSIRFQIVLKIMITGYPVPEMHHHLTCSDFLRNLAINLKS